MTEAALVGTRRHGFFGSLACRSLACARIPCADGAVAAPSSAVDDSPPAQGMPASTTALATTLSNVSLSWGTTTIDFTGRGAANDGTGGANGGAVELLVDGEVHATCKQWSSSIASCSVVNNLPPGPHAAAVRFRPENVRYASATSAVYSVANGPDLPPSTGFLIEAGRASINTRDVNLNVAGTDGGPVTAVRLSNTSTMSGELLADGTTFDYAAVVPWRLQAGVDGTRTVWGQLQSNGSWSEPDSTSIVLDTTAPSGSFVINDDAGTVGDPWNGTLSEQTL